MKTKHSTKRTARIAGLLYLVVIVTGVFAKFFVREDIFVAGDAATTVQNIIASEGLFRLGFVSDLIMQTVYFFLPLALYLILKPVNKRYASLMVLCVVVAVAIMCVNMLNHLAALLIINGGDYLGGFNSEQLNGMVMFFLNMHKHGYLIAQIFFGLWLFPLGYLIYKSNLFPGILGIILMIGSGGYLLDFLSFFLIPGYNETINLVLTTPADLGEFSLCIWLLIKGVRSPKN